MPNKIFADFNNVDKTGRVRLNTKGTLDDLERKQIILETGLVLQLDDDDELSMRGVVEFSETENIWVAVVEWDDI